MAEADDESKTNEMSPGSFTALLREYQGIVGALLGALFGGLLTLATTLELRSTGAKTSCQVTKWSTDLRSLRGGDAKTIEQAGQLTYVLDVDLFNASDVPRGLRGFVVTVETDSRSIVATGSPLDRESRHPYPFPDDWSHTACDPVRVVNLSPHSFQPLSLRGSFSRDDSPLLFKPGRYVVVLQAVDSRGHEARWIVARGYAIGLA